MHSYVCYILCMYIHTVRYSQSNLLIVVGTLYGTPNLYFLSELLSINTGWHTIHELGSG